MTPDTLGYCRVSTESQAREDKTSIADQRAAIERLAETLGRQLSDAAVFTDAGVSGADAEGRPAFMRLVAFCEANRRSARSPGYVLVLNDSRFGRFRDPEEAVVWRFRLKQAGWLVRFAEGDETQDPLGRSVIRTVHAAQASAYRANIQANAKRGARGTAAQGYWQNEAPLGYRRLATRNGADPVVLEPGQRKADDQKVRLTPGPEPEQALVRWIFDSYAGGTYSLGKLSRELRRGGCVSGPVPPRRWSRGTVEAVLRNVAYVGDVVWCRRPHDKQERRETPVRAQSEWVTTPDAHPPLIGRELFAAVQARLRTNAKQIRRTDGSYFLSGLLTCAQCGNVYVGGGGPKNKRDPKDPDRYRFYKDGGGINDKDACSGRLGTLQKRFVEPAVLDVIAAEVARPEVQRAIAKELDRVLSATHDDQAATRKQLERDRSRLTAQRDALVAAVARGVMSDDDARNTLARLRAEIDQVTAALERVRFHQRTTNVVESEKERLLALARDFRARAAEAPGPALRELIRPWLANAVVDKEKRTIALSIRRVPADMLLSLSPVRGSRSPVAAGG